MEKRIRLLVIDDNQETLAGLNDFLSKKKYEVTTALDGLDGLQVCKLLGENESTKDIPVIFVTSMSDPANEELGLQAGAVDYISKLPGNRGAAARSAALFVARMPEIQER